MAIKSTAREFGRLGSAYVALGVAQKNLSDVQPLISHIKDEMREDLEERREKRAGRALLVQQLMLLSSRIGENIQRQQQLETGAREMGISTPKKSIWDWFKIGIGGVGEQEKYGPQGIRGSGLRRIGEAVETGSPAIEQLKEAMSEYQAMTPSSKLDVEVFNQDLMQKSNALQRERMIKDLMSKYR